MDHNTIHSPLSTAVSSQQSAVSHYFVFPYLLVPHNPYNPSDPCAAVGTHFYGVPCWPDWCENYAIRIDRFGSKNRAAHCINMQAENESFRLGETVEMLPENRSRPTE